MSSQFKGWVGYAGGVCSGLALVGTPGGSLVRVSKSVFDLRGLQCRTRGLFSTLQACSDDFGTREAGPKIGAVSLQGQKNAPGAALQAPKVENRLRHPDKRPSKEGLPEQA